MTAGGDPFTNQPVVSILNAFGDVIDTSTLTVTIIKYSGPSGATLSGTHVQTASAGIASFSDLSFDTAGTYTITATTGGVSPLSIHSNEFSVTVGTATQMRFVTQPAGAYGGVAFSTQPELQVVDAGNNAVTNSNATITLSKHSGPGALGGAASAATIQGEALYTDLLIDTAGPNYVLIATEASSTFDAVYSNMFAVYSGSATQLLFTSQPSGSTGGIVFGIQPVVVVLDAGGNSVSAFEGSVTLSKQSGPGTLSGSTTVSAVNGVASFSGLSFDTAGSYVLSASSSGSATLTVVSSTITVAVGAPSQLSFTAQPSDSTGGSEFGTQPVVTVQDAGANTVSNNSDTVRLTVSGPGSLTGSSSKEAVLGVASFVGLSLDLAGAYVLTATISGQSALSVGSQTITVSVGLVSSIMFVSQPANAAVGIEFCRQPEVHLRDAGGNTVTTIDMIITLSTHTGPGLLSGSHSVMTSSGVASFTGLSYDTAGTYRLSATSVGQYTFADTSDTFAVVADSTAQIVFTTQPADITGGLPFGSQPTITAMNSAGETVPTNSLSVELSKQSGPGTLSGTSTLLANCGVASFSGLSFDTAGSYVLSASSSGSATLTVASSTITVSVGPAAQLSFTAQPSDPTRRNSFTLPVQPSVVVQDAGYNTVTSAAVTLRASKESGPGTLSGTTNVTAVGGLVSFTDLALSTSGTYVLAITSIEDETLSVSTSSFQFNSQRESKDSDNTLLYTILALCLTALLALVAGVLVARDYPQMCCLCFSSLVTPDEKEKPRSPETDPLSPQVPDPLSPTHLQTLSYDGSPIDWHAVKLEGNLARSTGGQTSPVCYINNKPVYGDTSDDQVEYMRSVQVELKVDVPWSNCGVDDETPQPVCYINNKPVYVNTSDDQVEYMRSVQVELKVDVPWANCGVDDNPPQPAQAPALDVVEHEEHTEALTTVPLDDVMHVDPSKQNATLDVAKISARLGKILMYKKNAELDMNRIDPMTPRTDHLRRELAPLPPPSPELKGHHDPDVYPLSPPCRFKMVGQVAHVLVSLHSLWLSSVFLPWSILVCKSVVAWLVPVVAASVAVFRYSTQLLCYRWQVK